MKMEEYTIMLTVSLYKNTYTQQLFYIGFLISNMISENNVNIRNIVIKFC
jgi:hypothetical protein